jgi:hypothetical protein
VSGANGAVAFEATVAGAASTATGIWCAQDGVTPKLIAMSGDSAPGGGRFAKFISMVLPAYTSGSDGPIFIATLALGAADGVTGGNNLGLWAVDSSGNARLLIRTGESFIIDNETKIVGTFSALTPTPGTLGAASGYDSDGNVSVLVTFTDRSQTAITLRAPWR